MCTVAGPFDSATYKKHSSCLGSWNFDHSPTMDDPEPGRCRRTDGRKWRCSKNAVPSEKYCGRHMHRGRLSSRKHVEPTKSISNPDNIRTPITPVVESGIDDRIAISLGPSQPCPKGGVIGKTAAACQLGTKVSKSFNNCDTTSIYTDPVKSESTSSDSHAKLKGKESKDTGLEKVNPRSISSRKRRLDQNNSLGCLSPKSVLKYNAGKVMDLDSKNNAVETEPRRCRRTDGKKWQCKRNALPNQKYCEAHMHRGAKRLLLYPRSLSSVPATLDRMAHISCTKVKDLDNGINLNTMPTSPQQMSCNNSSGSTSDATTITDENVSICLTQSLRDC